VQRVQAKTGFGEGFLEGREKGKGEMRRVKGEVFGKGRKSGGVCE
jgi:hypothetical protein